MTSLITLPIRLSLEITVRAAKLGIGVVRAVAGALETDKAEQRAPWPVEDVPVAPAPTNGRAAAPAPEPPPPPEPPPLPEAPPPREPPPAPQHVEAPIDFDAPAEEELAPRHVDTDATIAYEAGPAEDVGAAIHVEAPWEGYDQMKAAEIVKRLRSANDATRAVARLYERQGKARASVLAAAG
jgi:outer membrane biosynthesis protein TonB